MGAVRQACASGAIDEWSPTGSAEHEAFADAYAKTARELRVKSTKLGVVLSLLLHGGAGFVGFYDEIRTRMALAAERRWRRSSRKRCGSPNRAPRSERAPMGAVAGRGRLGGHLRRSRGFAPRKPLQVTFGDPIEIRWTDDGCGGTLEPVAVLTPAVENTSLG